MVQYVPTIGVLLVSGSIVLLVKHTEKAGHLTDTYGLPAGRVEEGEALLDAAARELEEETGLKVEKNDLMKVSNVFFADIERKGGGVMKFEWHVFAANQFEGEIKSSEETVPEWVDLSQVSKFNLLPNTENAIKEGLQLLNK